jgi:hypothetical protein
MLEHVIRPSRQGTNTRLWTYNNCESMNHRFKISTEWKPKYNELCTKRSCDSLSDFLLNTEINVFVIFMYVTLH